jgi:hypothetical protein
MAPRASADAGTLVAHARVVPKSPRVWVMPTLLAVSCGPPVDRREYGDQWVPPPDTLAGIDFGEDGEGADASTGDPAQIDGGAVDDAPMQEDGGPPADGGSHDDAPHTTGPPALDTGDGGGAGESPYQGGWDIGDCQDEVVATGTQIGQVVPDFQLTDQFGDTVRLHDFCHKAVFITDGAFW